MAQLFINNAASTLASGITDIATSLTVANGALFPAPTGGDYFMLTLTQATSETSWEVVKVTARAADVLTVVRAQEGTTAAAWGSGSKAELRVTAESLNGLAVATQTHAATDKAAPVDADEIPLSDSAATWGLKKLTWANLKATLKAYFDTLYPAPNADTTGTAAKANALNSATTVVNVSSATAPTSGQVLTATSGTAATWQAPSNTFSGAVLNDGYTEEVYAVSGTTPALSPTNGSIQTWTLTAASTPTAGTWAAGQSITLMVVDGTAYAITWTSLAVTWKTDGGVAPTLNTTGYTVIALWKVGTTIYGARVGDA